MRATIKMIAEKAGVSIGTVDRVLHDRPYVKAEVKERVLQVMEELEYSPNRMASALAMSGTARKLALIQPSWGSGYIRQEIEGGAARFREEHRDYNLTADVLDYPQEDMAACLRQVDRAVENGAQAVALCASDCPEVRAKLEELAKKNIHVATYNSDIAGAPRLCYVGEDARHAGRVAGEIAAKFLRPGEPYLVAYAGPAYAGHKGRADGFLERLEELGLRRADCRVAYTHNNYDETYRAVRQALSEEPELRYIYMVTLSVPGCVDAIRAAGREGRVRVLAHDNGPDICRLLREGAVDFTIGQDLAYQSYQALHLLFRAVAEHKLPEKDCYYPASPILNAETI